MTDASAARPARSSQLVAGSAMQCRALGYDRRSQLIGVGVGVAAPTAAAIASWGRVGFAVLLLAVLVPGPAILAWAATRRRALWPAEDVLVWLTVGMEDEWRRETGGLWPKSQDGAVTWLAVHPESTVPPHLLVSALLTAGRVEDARRLAAAMPAETPRELHRKLDIRMVFEVRDGLDVDETAAAADASARADTSSTPELLATHIGRHASMVAQGHGRDGLAELAAARPAIGPLKGRLARRVWRVRFRFAVVSLLVGAWILVAMALSGAASGAVFWI